MFNQNDTEKKLAWMYKGANSLVDREEYLLGRTVDKSLEQLNAEEKQKQLGTAAPPKNHVEHECIPPSIRDYKLQQQLAEQVDLQAKLQEDPLLMIKKQEEETRRQFLQNPVQLKKLQKALSKQEKKSKNKKKAYLDEILLQKLKLLQKNSDDLDDNIIDKKEKKEKDLDIILMHKFNALKSKLTEEDLKDIMDGKFTDSSASDSENDSETMNLNKNKGRVEKKVQKKKKKKSRSKSSDDISSSEEEKQKQKKKRKSKRNKKRDKSSSSSSESDSDSESDEKRKSKKYKRRNKPDKKKKLKRESSSESSSSEDDRKKCSKRRNEKRENRRRSTSPMKNKIKGRDTEEEVRKEKQTKREKNRNRSRSKSRSRSPIKKSTSSKQDKRTERRRSRSKSRSRSKDNKRRIGPERPPSNYSHSQRNSDDSDDNRRHPKIQNWGLVKSDGTQIAFNRRSRSTSRERRETRKAKLQTAKKDEIASQKAPHRSKRLTSAEKEDMLREMRKNADEQDVERAKNIKRYRAEDAKEALQRDFDENFARKEYIKSTNSSTVESRIKANLNNIQRGKSDMNSHFSRRH